MATCNQNRPRLYIYIYARSDLPHPFQFRLSKEGTDHIVQNWPGSDLDGLVRVWPNASGLEASWCAGIVWPGFWQNATGPLPASHFQTRFHSSTDVPDNIAQNQPGSALVLADCVRFWPNGSGPEASRCARIIWPMISIRSGLKHITGSKDRLKIGSGIFTGTWNLLACQVIIIIMYIYQALINAVSAHMIHINLHMISYTHVEHSPTKTIYLKYYLKHTHTHKTTTTTNTRTHARTHARTHTHTHTQWL